MEISMARVIANVLVLGCLGVVAACEPESTDIPNGSGGGGAASGGGAAITGGVSATGGAASGGRATGGQSPSTGGKATGGMASGGTASGTGGNRGTGGGATSGTAPSAGCGSPAGLASGRASIDVNGKTREYILRLPDNYDQNHPYRLIFAWHHLTGTAQMMASMGYYGLQAPSANQAILVAPEGVPANDKGELGWPNKNGEDVDFYFAMLDRFRSELCIDENRIFSLGFSYGAMFSFTLACTANTMTRAIAPQAGGAMGGCRNTQPVAVMGFIGTQDSLRSSHLQAVDGFVQRNGCSTPGVEMSPSWCDGLGSNYLPCSCLQYSNCNPGYPVISCEYKNGHMFAPNSGQAIWNFFSQF